VADGVVRERDEIANRSKSKGPAIVDFTNGTTELTPMNKRQAD